MTCGTHLPPWHSPWVGKFLFVPYPAWGHVNPMLPVIERLVAGGDAVRVLVSRGFVTAVRGVGAVPVVPARQFDPHVPPGFDVVRRVRSQAWKMLAMRAAAARLVEEMLQRPDVVVYDSMAPWAARIARRGSVPSVLFSTTYLSRHRRGRPALVHAVPELQPAVSGDVRVLGPLVRGVDNVELAGLRSLEGKVLLVSPGTVFEREPAFFRMVAEAFGATDWTVVLVTGALDPQALGVLPANVIARRKVPQLALLGVATAFLTHAGMNSVLEALVAGVPMVFAPRRREQRATARRLADLGVGVELPQRCSSELVRDLVEHVAEDPEVRRALRDVQGRLPADGACVAAEVLRQVVSGSPRNTEVMSTSIRAAAVNSSTADESAST